MYLTMPMEWASNRLLMTLADQKQHLCDSCSFSERTAYCDPCRDSQNMSSKIHYTYQSINKSRMQILQVTWWPGPCKQIQALIGVRKGINCKNNRRILMFINHPDSGMLQHRFFLLSSDRAHTHYQSQWCFQIYSCGFLSLYFIYMPK